MEQCPDYQGYKGQRCMMVKIVREHDINQARFRSTAKIVQASTQFSKEIGVQWACSGTGVWGVTPVGTGGGRHVKVSLRMQLPSGRQLPGSRLLASNGMQNGVIPYNLKPPCYPGGRVRRLCLGIHRQRGLPLHLESLSAMENEG